MKIIYLEVSSRGLDEPIRFPAPCQPCLKDAPDKRIRTDADLDEDTLKHEPKITDAKQAIKIPRLV
jgi:hypothetical protein